MAGPLGAGPRRRCLVSGLVAIVAIILMIHFARQNAPRRRWQGLMRESGFSPEDREELERRLAAVEQLEGRVLELENRLDFAERLLTSRSQSDVSAETH